MAGELQEGAKAPAFKLPADGGTTVTLADFKGKALPYFTTHADLVKRQTERKAAQKAAAAAAPAKKMVQADGEWSGDDFVKQSNALAR